MKEAVEFQMVCMSPNNDRHPAPKTFTPLHYTCRHITSSHLKLYPSTLHYPLVWLNPI